MSASANDLVRNAAPNFATTLAAPIAGAGDTSMTLSTVTGLPTGTGITLTIDATNASGVSTPAVKETVTGVVSGSDIVNLLRGRDGTTAQAHSTGANVVMWFTANDWNDFQSAFTAQHSQLDGSHKAVTATSIANSGNESVGGTLSVTGASTLTGNVQMDGNATVAGTTTMNGLAVTAVASTTSGATITPVATANQYNVTALASAATIAAPAGTPVDGQTLLLRIKDNGTPQTLTWNVIYRAIGVTIPTATVASKQLYVGMKYNAADATWDVLSIGRQ